MKQEKLISPYAAPGIKAECMPIFFGHYRTRKNGRNDEMNRLVRIVCDFYGISEMEFHSPRRFNIFVKARMSFAVICYKYFRITCTEIAEFLKKDHTTILHYSKTLLGEIEVDNVLALEFQTLSAKVF